MRRTGPGSPAAPAECVSSAPVPAGGAAAAAAAAAPLRAFFSLGAPCSAGSDVGDTATAACDAALAAALAALVATAPRGPARGPAASLLPLPAAAAAAAGPPLAVPGLASRLRLSAARSRWAGETPGIQSRQVSRAEVEASASGLPPAACTFLSGHH